VWSEASGGGGSGDSGGSTDGGSGGGSGGTDSSEPCLNYPWYTNSCGGNILSVQAISVKTMLANLNIILDEDQLSFLNDNTSITINIRTFLSANNNTDGAKFAVEMINALMNNPQPTYTTLDYLGKNDGLNYQWWLDDSQIELIMGDPYETWKKVSKREKELVKGFPNDAYQIYKNKTIAFQKTNQIFGNVPGNLNGKADAFRHAFFQAINTVKIGKYDTKLFADAHESETPNNLIKEKQMDLSNNEKGMDLIAFDHPNWTDINLIANEVFNLISTGQLVYLSPINYNSTSFWDDPNTTILNDGNHGISQNTQLIPTNQ
jgi:hypothetical protein